MMAEYIKLEDTIVIIEEKQKELCPVGRYGRNYVYGSDRDKYDAWDEIIDALENIPSADVAPVVHGRWISCKYATSENEDCSNCGYSTYYGNGYDYCPNCRAKMDGGDSDEAD